jgi:hypothetical protein
MFPNLIEIVLPAWSNVGVGRVQVEEWLEVRRDKGKKLQSLVIHLNNLNLYAMPFIDHEKL